MKNHKSLKFVCLLTVFCLVIAYFSALTPTTAYFSDTITDDINVSFSLLSTYQTISSTDVDINLKAATKFEDFDEILFDDVVYDQFITVTNDGEIPARIIININIPQASETNGLKYIIISTGIVNGTPSFAVPTGTNARKGDIKELIENRLYSFNHTFVSGISESDAVTILDNYNNQFKTFSTAPLLEVGESIGFKIYFWAEYGNIENTIKDTSSISSFDYSADVILKAYQNTAAAA